MTSAWESNRKAQAVAKEVLGVIGLSILADDTETLIVRRNRGFQACIDAIPEMGSILSERPEIGWKALEKKSGEYLMARLEGLST